MLLTIVPAPLMILLLLDTTALMLVRGYHHQQPTNSRCIPLSSRHFPRCDTKYLSGAVAPALRISYDDRESDKEEVQMYHDLTAVVHDCMMPSMDLSIVLYVCRCSRLV